MCHQRPNVLFEGGDNRRVREELLDGRVVGVHLLCQVETMPAQKVVLASMVVITIRPTKLSQRLTPHIRSLLR